MSNKNEPGYFGFITSEVLHDPNLSDRSKLLFCHISVLVKKEGYCWASNAYFEKAFNVKKNAINNSLRELEEGGFIRREVIYKEGTKAIEKRKIYIVLGSIPRNTTSIPEDTTASIPGNTSPIIPGDTDNRIKDNKIKDNTSAQPSAEASVQIKLENAFWDKLVPAYPQNRIGNRQHAFKKFQNLEIEEQKLVLKNLKRYLASNGGFVKVLQNYLTERCWSEEWLKANEEMEQMKQDSSKSDYHKRLTAAGYANEEEREKDIEYAKSKGARVQKVGYINQETGEIEWK